MHQRPAAKKSAMPLKISINMMKVAQTFSFLEVVWCKMKSGWTILQ